MGNRSVIPNRCFYIFVHRYKIIKGLIRLSILFIICTALIAVPPFILASTGLDHLIAPGFWSMFAFFFIVTYITCSIVVLGQQNGSKLGVQLFLIATIVKLLSCMVFALIYVEKMPVKPITFMLSFFYLYLLNTVFEIYTLLSNLRVQNKK